MSSSLLLAASETADSIRRPRHPPLASGPPSSRSSPLLLVVDLLSSTAKPTRSHFKEAAIESAIWITHRVAFTGVIYLIGGGQGGAAAGEYISGFLLEKSLSVDNVFVWAVIFTYFAVPPKYQFRTLFWGIFGALVLRAAFIFAGSP